MSEYEMFGNRIRNNVIRILIYIYKLDSLGYKMPVSHNVRRPNSSSRNKIAALPKEKSCGTIQRTKESLTKPTQSSSKAVSLVNIPLEDEDDRSLKKSILRYYRKII